MIIFERTEGDGMAFRLEGIKLEITGGYTTDINTYIEHFVSFLLALSFSQETITDGLRDYLED